MKRLISIFGTLLTFSVSNSPLLAQTIVPAADGTQTIVTPDGNRFDITGGSLSGDGRNLFHSFAEFGLNFEQIANFLVNNPQVGNVLSRVVGGNPSIINGLIQLSGSNANLFIINPAGIVFGSNASLNVPASFTATTATGIGFEGGWFNAVGTPDFANLVGNPIGFAFANGDPGTIINAGNLSVSPGHSINLAGGTVINTGSINAPGGGINITAIEGGNWVRISAAGNILSLEMPIPQDANGDVLSQIQPTDIPTLLTTVPNLGLEVNNNGNITLSSSNTEIPTQSGTVIVSGELNTAATLGGKIEVTAPRLALIDANVNASGTNGGGEILLGGDVSGQGILPNAQNVYISQDSVINADALVQGDGGKVIVYGDDTAQFYGTITARGGNLGGDGGFIETSGKNYLETAGEIDASAINGQPGQWLIDPSDVVIQDLAQSLPEGGFSGGNPNIFTPTGTTGQSIADRTTIQNSLNQGTSVTITTTNPNATADGNITVAQGITKSTGFSATLTLNAENDIAVNDDIIATSTGGFLNLNLFADSDANGTGAISIGDPLGSTVTISTNGGSFVAIANDSARIDDGGDFDRPAISIANSTINTAGGNITLDGQGNQSGISGILNGNTGIVIDSSTLDAGGGQITFNGVGGSGSGTGAVGAAGIELLDGSIVQTTGFGFGGISLEGVGGIAADGTVSPGISLGNTTINADFFSNLIFSADEIAIQTGATPIITGNGTIQIQPATPGTGITVGGSIDDNNLNLNSDKLAILLANTPSGGFPQEYSEIIIGRSDLTGNLTVVEALTFTDPITFQANTLQIDGTITGQDDASITLNGIGNTTTLNTNLTTAGTPIIINDSVILGDNITLSTLDSGAPGASVIITGTIDSDDLPRSLTITAGIGDVQTFGAIGSSFLLNDVTFTGDTIFTNDINTIPIGDVTLTGGNVTLTGSNTVSTNNITTNGGAIAITATNDLTTQTLDSTAEAGTAGTITLTSSEGEISTADVIAGTNIDPTSSVAGSTITIEAQGDISTNSLISGSASGFSGGNIQVTSQSGSVSINGLIISGAAAGDGGDVTITALDDIFTDTIFSGSLGTGTGGNITLTSQTGSITSISIIPIPDDTTLQLSGLNSRSALGQGGNITLDADISITTGNINSSGGNGGGNVTLDPQGDIQVSFINAQGGAGTGGTVDITTESFFRATGTFVDQTGLISSIATVGGAGGGAITIRHGGNGITPFIVGDATLNGTAGAINSGNFTIPEGEFLFTTRVGNIGIISVDAPIIPPEPPITPPEPPITPPEPPIFPPESGQLFLAEIDTILQGSIVPGVQAVAVASPPLVISTIAQIQEILNLIAQTANERPAIVYVNFVTPDVSSKVVSDEYIAQREAELIAQYDDVVAVENPQAGATLSIVPPENYELELLLITPEAEPLRVQIAGATREKVLAEAEKLYQDIFNLRAGHKDAGTQMYQWLLEPLAKELETREVDNVLFFMPTGLRLVPLSALYDPQEQKYVAQKPYTVGFAPSINLLDYRYRNLQDAKVLAFGASQFPEDQQQVPLPAVDVEVPAIAGNIRTGQYFLNQNFTLEQFQQERLSDPFPIVHLATHADFLPQDPTQSYIQLYDQKLRLKEWRELNLKTPTVDLLVISACKTAYGSEEVELGFGGMAVQAGVKTVIASLWEVGDAGTLGLMTEFYRQLKETRTKARALQLAQQQMINGEIRKQGTEIITPQGRFPLSPDAGRIAEDLSHPYYWAPFTTIGSPW